jgi:glycerol uptake facilitator-like aquaporin
MALVGNLPWREASTYLAAQFAGAFAAVATARLMFAKPLFFACLHPRRGAAQLGSEMVATFGLLLVICSCARFRPLAAAYSVGASVAAAY